MASLDQKPLNGKIPPIARHAARSDQYVLGISFLRPPMAMRSLLCTAWISDPAPRKSIHLKKAWVKTWYIAAE